MVKERVDTMGDNNEEGSLGQGPKWEAHYRTAIPVSQRNDRAGYFVVFLPWKKHSPVTYKYKTQKKGLEWSAMRVWKEAQILMEEY